MVAACVRSGPLNEQLVYNTCQEMYFQYAKIQPYLIEFRRQMNLPEWMMSIEALVEGSPEGRDRLAVMRKNRDYSLFDVILEPANAKDLADSISNQPDPSQPAFGPPNSRCLNPVAGARLADSFGKVITNPALR